MKQALHNSHRSKSNGTAFPYHFEKLYVHTVIQKKLSLTLNNNYYLNMSWIINLLSYKIEDDP
jgi:hypothetical protein